MYISMVEFTVGPEDKEKFAAKIERDTETLKTVNGVLSTEAWTAVSRRPCCGPRSPPAFR